MSPLPFFNLNKLPGTFDRKTIVRFFEATGRIVLIGKANGELIYANQAARAYCGLILNTQAQTMMENIIAWDQVDPWESDKNECSRAINLKVKDADGTWIPHAFELHRISTDENETAFLLFEAGRAHTTDDHRATLATFAGGIAHRMNNTLGVIRLQAELLAQVVKEGYAAKAAQNLLQSSRDAEAFIENIAELSDISLMSRHPLDLAALCATFQAEIHAELPDTVRLHLSSPPEQLMIDADETAFKELLTRLFDNALVAIEGSGEITLSIEKIGVSHVQLLITDNGKGIPQNLTRRVFDPFYTTRGFTRAAGLGLTICRAIVEQHHGQIDILPPGNPPTGTTVRVILPLSEQQ